MFTNFFVSEEQSDRMFRVVIVGFLLIGLSSCAPAPTKTPPPSMEGNMEDKEVIDQEADNMVGCLGFLYFQAQHSVCCQQ